MQEIFLQRKQTVNNLFCFKTFKLPSSKSCNLLQINYTFPHKQVKSPNIDEFL